HLDPQRKKGAWTAEEEILVAEARTAGRRWVDIADMLGRTNGDVKNRYYNAVRKQ
ncbi:hypothetical protein JKP88DRAFT_135885, partial [Tribonema minus]